MPHHAGALVVPPTCPSSPPSLPPAQVLANRPDIMRQDYMNELCVLQDDVPSFPDEQARPPAARCGPIMLHCAVLCCAVLRCDVL